MGGELRDRGRRTDLPGQRLKDTELPGYFWEQFPYYLAYGMTSDEYWNGDNRLCRAYRKAYELKMQVENANEHRLGAYIYTALGNISPLFRFSTRREKAIPYPPEPFAITKQQVEERKQRDFENRREAFFAKLNSMRHKEADTNG